MAHTITPIPRGTNQAPWLLDLPYNPANRFAAAQLGCLMNTGLVADPTAASYRHLIAPGTWQPSGDNRSAGDDHAIANPTDLGVGYYYWVGNLEPADICLIRPFMVNYGDNTHAALGTALTAAAATAKMAFWTTSPVGKKTAGRALEYAAEYIGIVTITNAATVVNAATLELPVGAQFCQSASAGEDKSISPGIRFKGDATGGALDIFFDQQRGSGLLVRVSSISSAAIGVGWLRSSM
jgi:hypothetical protein